MAEQDQTLVCGFASATMQPLLGWTVMRDIKELEKTLRIGDHISDSELKRLHEHFAILEESLRELGPYWHFAWVEAQRIKHDTRDFLQNRVHAARKYGKPGTPEHLKNNCGHLKSYKCNGAACDYMNGKRVR